MSLIKLETIINSPIENVFDNSRDIDLHQKSASQTNEKAISGKTSGLINLNETVSWEAIHFGIKQHLTVKITQFDFPNSFTDEMIEGSFKSMKHIHEFEKINDDQTKMIDLFYFESPLGIIGKAVDFIFLKKYMKNFLIKRNKVLKDYAEAENSQKN